MAYCLVIDAVVVTLADISHFLFYIFCLLIFAGGLPGILIIPGFLYFLVCAFLIAPQLLICGWKALFSIITKIFILLVSPE